jgi:hypothetical protein
MTLNSSNKVNYKSGWLNAVYFGIVTVGTQKGVEKEKEE